MTPSKVSRTHGVLHWIYMRYRVNYLKVYFLFFFPFFYIHWFFFYCFFHFWYFLIRFFFFFSVFLSFFLSKLHPKMPLLKLPESTVWRRYRNHLTLYNLPVRVWESFFFYAFLQSVHAWIPLFKRSKEWQKWNANHIATNLLCYWFITLYTDGTALWLWHFLNLFILFQHCWWVC